MCRRRDPEDPAVPSGQERERGLVFGEVAERYERARPGYPPAIVGEVAEILGLPPRAHVLEVGSGTGKATVLWADAGYDVVCLEPDEKMAAIARRKFAGRENVTVETVGLEAWPVEDEAFDLVTAAQAWHWVPADVRLPTAQTALRPGGGVALIWNWERDRSTDVHDAFDHVYQSLAPTLVQEPLKRRIEDGIRDELDAAPGFGPVTVRTYPWERTFTAAGYVDLLGTHSDHRMLPSEDRDRLHDAIAGVIDGWGGEITLGYTTAVLIAARR
jgi:SAM-dependent methyltransferase